MLDSIRALRANCRLCQNKTFLPFLGNQLHCKNYWHLLFFNRDATVWQ
jgi:hypothetical protein